MRFIEFLNETISIVRDGKVEDGWLIIGQSGDDLKVTKDNQTKIISKREVFQQQPKEKLVYNRKILNFASRDVTVIKIGNLKQGFYRSSGKNSDMPGVWLPFDGVGFHPGSGLWFDKKRFATKDKLHRFGTQQLKDISQELTNMNIPSGEVVDADESQRINAARKINYYINTEQSLANQKILDSIYQE